MVSSEVAAAPYVLGPPKVRPTQGNVYLGLPLKFMYPRELYYPLES